MAIGLCLGACTENEGTVDAVKVGNDPSAPDDGSSPHEDPDATPPDDPGTPTGEKMSFFPARPSPIAEENAKPGDRGWKLDRSSKDIGVFFDRTSYLPGETVGVHAGATNATLASWELWRLGYYGGKGGRKILSGASVKVPTAAAAELDPVTGAVSAPWPQTFKFTLPEDAVTGVYVIKISADVGQSYGIMVVKEKTPAAPIVYPLSFNTYAAYNNWGGTSLYVNRRSDFAGRHGYGASFDRPFSSGNGLGSFSLKDRPFLFFAEAQGYDIAYASDVDLTVDSKLTWGRRLLIIQGHSEYWTGAMRDQADAAVARGTNLLNLGANNAYWQVRLEAAKDGRPNRVVVGYRDEAQRLDPMYRTAPARSTVLFRDAALGRPENALFGTMFGDWIFNSAPLTVMNANHWVWTGAGVKNGDLISGVFGDEVDHRFDNGKTPSDLTVLGEATVEAYEGVAGKGEMTIYRAPSGAEVFSAGSITWSAVLGLETAWDRRLQQVLANLISRYAGDGTLGPAALKPVSLPAVNAVSYSKRAQVTTIARGLDAPAAIALDPGGNAVVADGNRIVRVTPAGAVQVIAGSREPGENPLDAVVPAAEARFRGPRGIAVDRTGRIFVADTKNHRIRLIENGTVRTIAGQWEGFADGKGAQARFTQPMGMAMRSTGSVLVADTWNMRIREVTPDGTVTTWAGTGASGLRNGPGATATLHYPMTVSIKPDGRAVITEAGSGVVRAISNEPGHEVFTIAGEIARMGWIDGEVSTASVSETTAAVALNDGDVLLFDGASSRVRLWAFGQVRTVAGGSVGGTVDGVGEAAGFGFLRAGATAPDGSVWAVDLREGTVRRIVIP